MIQLYGRFDGWWSHSVVSRGIVEGLLENGLHGLRIWNVAGDPAAANGQYERVHPRAVVGYNAEAPIGFYVGGYAPMATQWLEGHAIRGALLIAESEAVPAEWGRVARSLARLWVPSSWVKAAFADVHVPRGRIDVVPHGVDRVFREPLTLAATPAPSVLRLLHVAGAASFLDRKGTPQLLRAFESCVAGGLQAELTLRTPMDEGLPIHELLGRLSLATRRCMHIDGTLAEPPEAMARLLARHHLVIQPSRAEAFGLIPCEARALGVPVALTPGSGHAEHIETEDLLIPIGESKPIAVNGIPLGGRAPTVSVGAIVKVLRTLPRCYARAADAARRRAADGYARRLSWKRQTRRLADWLEYQQKRVRLAGRGGIQLEV